MYTALDIQQGKSMAVHISQLFYHPIKSLQGISTPKLNVSSFGPHNDRRLMLVDAQGGFVTQRECATMAMINVIDSNGVLNLSFMGQSISFPWPDFSLTSESRSVQIWEDNVSAQKVDHPVNEWLSQVLQLQVKLVYMDDNTHRQVDLDYADWGVRTGFSDGFPFLLVSQASIDFLQGELEFDLDVKRFRPNIVVSGCEPFAEDQWKKIRINQIEFDLVKPCSRCVIPSLNNQTGISQKEVMQVMVTHRKRGDQVFVGQNLLHSGLGDIQVGHKVELIS